MKKLILLLSVLLVVASCGSKKNNVSSDGQSGSNGESIDPTTGLVSFAGNYDLVQNEGDDCGGNITIEAACNGYKLTSNHTRMVEEFCNINRNDRRRDDRNPGPGPSNESAVVTQRGNVLTSELTFNPNFKWTNQLTLNGSTLVKVSNLKSRASRCTYSKRQ
jgi:hypothetical protein